MKYYQIFPVAKILLYDSSQDEIELQIYFHIRSLYRIEHRNLLSLLQNFHPYNGMHTNEQNKNFHLQQGFDFH